VALTSARPKAALLAVSFGTAILCLGHWLEADMARHMLIELPLLVLTGIVAARAFPERATVWLMGCNRSGIAGLTFVSLTAAYWMIPVVLDQSLASVPAAAAKYASFFVAGVLLPISCRAAPLALQAFFVGNWIWMFATIGLLYQNPSQQFCVNYLLAGQWNAGEGLVAAAVAVAVLWVASAIPRYLQSDEAPNEVHVEATKTS